MRLRVVVLIGIAILAVGFAGGFYLSLLLAKQLILLCVAAFAFAFLTWLGSGADFIGLFRDVVKQSREEESRRNTTIYAELEPLFIDVHNHLYLALAAFDQKNAPDYSLHLHSIEMEIDKLFAQGKFYRQAKFASQVYDKFRAIRTEIKNDCRKHNGNYGSLISDTELAKLVLQCRDEISLWLYNWEKWRR